MIPGSQSVRPTKSKVQGLAGSFWAPPHQGPKRARETHVYIFKTRFLEGLPKRRILMSPAGLGWPGLAWAGLGKPG